MMRSKFVRVQFIRDTDPLECRGIVYKHGDILATSPDRAAYWIDTGAAKLWEDTYE